ncbi:late embryogenesis abundant protein, LEA-14 [Artemisia annua]|uniref:Late embryogenesis abundant protein, LEA-14 n=1 Tax=Artemisia annua TaxID=35608 RepID=A0A2U1LR39_ARTAN|nr:late embryogenesis abundant protein, LEA-14 [Artemisia annua]
MNIEQKEEHPLNANNNNRRKRKRRTCICISITVSILLLIALVILILALTVFKPKKPVTTVNSIKIKDLDASVNLLPLRVSLNVSLDLDISIKNPNKVHVKYRNSTAVISYKGQEVGDVPIPAGEIGSDGTKQMNLTLTVFADRLLTNIDVYRDVISGNLPVSTYTRVASKVRLLNLFNIRVVSTSSCDLNISISDRSVSNQTCHYTNK